MPVEAVVQEVFALAQVSLAMLMLMCLFDMMSRTNLKKPIPCFLGLPRFLEGTLQHRWASPNLTQRSHGMVLEQAL